MRVSDKQCFVFALCGGAEHIDTLNFSLPFLKHFSEKEILVVTDTSRNDGRIEHDRIIDVRTPEKLDNHQASIFLKTSLNRILPEGPLYCYLDTDIIAMREGVDQIFLFYQAPVTFTTDHCRVRSFSASAVNCPCANDYKQEEVDLLNELLPKYDEMAAEIHLKQQQLLKVEDEYFELSGFRHQALSIPLRRKKQTLLEAFEQMPSNPLAAAWHLLSRILPIARPSFRPRGWRDWQGNQLIDRRDAEFAAYLENKYGIHWNAEKRTWEDGNGYALYTNGEATDLTPLEEIEKNTPFHWDPESKRWMNDRGFPVFHNPCDHLTEQIEQTFGIEVGEKDWQHWNGGVFLFDSRSHEFLDDWHRMTMEIFEQPEWKTRDQGTLIANCWKHGLQNHPTLPIELNFLADFFHPYLLHRKDQGFSFDNFRTTYKPHFLHIYHHWMDKDWSVWQLVEERGSELGIIQGEAVE